MTFNLSNPVVRGKGIIPHFPNSHGILTPCRIVNRTRFRTVASISIRARVMFMIKLPPVGIRSGEFFIGQHQITPYEKDTEDTFAT